MLIGPHCLLTRFLLRFAGALAAGLTINPIYPNRGDETEGFDITEAVRISAARLAERACR